MDAEKDGHKGTIVWCPVCKEHEFFQRNDGRPKTCSRKCARQKERDARGGHSPNWNGGRTVHPAGYIKLQSPGHPRADSGGYVMEHILVVEAREGRILEPHERVHHKNGQRADNRPENLELWKLKKKDPAGVRQADYHCPGCRCFAHDLLIPTKGER